MSDKPFGIDVSSWQGVMNWTVVSNHVPKVHFVIMRSGIGENFTDARFSENWEGTHKIGVLRSAYHAVHPDRDSKSQMDRFFSIFPNGYDGELPLCLDYELDRGQTPNKIRTSIIQCATLVERFTGRKPIIYSRAEWLNRCVEGGEWMNDYDWWLAQYLYTPTEHQGPPMLPKFVKREKIVIHQTSDHTPAIGAGGSKMMDYNRWQLGDVKTLYEYAGKKPELSDSDKLSLLWEAHKELHP